MRKILLIGNGAREHALAEALINSKHQVELYAFGQAINPGIKQLSIQYKVGSSSDFEAISAFASEVSPDFVVIGPDDPIGQGLGDFLLQHNNLRSVAPLKITAQLETSKAFTRELMAKYQIPGLPKFKVFHNADGISAFLADELGGNFVIKYDGLLGGKGVKLSGEHLPDINAGVAFAEECLADCDRVVIEEKLVGQEFSLLALADGENLYTFPAVQDHKRAYNGDEGPNTGGMGTYSDSDGSLPFLEANDLQDARQINQQILKAVKTETGTPFTGVLYGGFMVTSNGVRVIEYNARFGDPEAMNLLNLLKDDFVELCEAILAGDLNKFPAEFTKQATVCVYAVPKGYPENPQKGAIIKLNKGHYPAKVYFASVNLLNETDAYYELEMSGSRAIAFVGMGATIEEAREQALTGLGQIEGPIEYRTDIGSGAILQAKIKMMQNLRNS